MPKSKDRPESETSSGNVFADLGLPNPEELLVKSKLASQIQHVIKERGLTQAAAGKIMALDQGKVSMIVRGRLKDYSVDRLMDCLAAIGADIEIRVTRRRNKAVAKRPRGRITLAIT